VQAAIDFVRTRDIEALRTLLREQPQAAETRTPEGASLLAFAAYSGAGEAVLLIRAARPDIDPYEAIIVGDADRVQRALAEGWSADERAPDGFTALGLAAFFRQPAIFDILLPHTSDIDARARNAQSVAAIHAAASVGDASTAEKLLAAGADPNLAQARGITALHVAAANGNTELVALLLRFGARMDIADDRGKRAADYAGERGHAELAEQLTYSNPH
jgi:ankyrin repeat protein